MQCVSTYECSYFYECIANVCKHKDLLHPLSFLEFFTILLLCLTSVISTVAGAGGGVFFFPVIIAILKFDPKEAVAISLTSLAGILTCRYVMSIPERHLRRDKPLINYDISIIYCPSIIIGTIFGVLLNKFSPNWLLLTLVSLSMGYNFVETLKKARKYHKEEIAKEKSNKSLGNLNEKEMNHIKKIQDCLDPERTSFSSINNDRIRYSELESDVFYTEPQVPLTKSFLRKREKLLVEIIEEEAKLVPLKKLSILLINMFILSLFLCFQGNKTFHSLVGVEYCGTGYWIFQFGYIPFGLIFLYFSVQLLNREYEKKLQAGYLFIASDIKWDKKTAIISIFIGMAIGFSAAILGIGGAIISGPFFIKLGFHPQEATYTASFMATFTSIAGTIQYVISGMVAWDYTLMCFSTGIFGLFVGMKYVLEYIKKTNKASYIIYCLAFCIGCSTLVLIYGGIEKTIQDIKLNRFFKLKEVC